MSQAETLAITLRLRTRDGKWVDIPGGPEHFSRHLALAYDRRVFTYRGDDRQDGKWVRLYHEVHLVRLDTDPTGSPPEGHALVRVTSAADLVKVKGVA